MPSPVLSRRPRRQAAEVGLRPQAWRGGTFLLAGASLPLGQEDRRQRRRSMAISVAVQAVLVLAIVAALLVGPPALPPAATAGEAVEMVLAPAPQPTPEIALPPPRVHPRRLVAAPRRAQPLPRRPERATAARVAVPAAPLVPERGAAPELSEPERIAPPPPEVRLGAFGDPQGLEARKATPVPAPVMGNFGAADEAAPPPDPPAGKVNAAGFGAGGGRAADTGRKGGRVRRAGFASAAAATGSEGATKAAVRLHAFAAPRPALTPAPAAASRSEAGAKPPEVLTWPEPVYTAAARQHHVEGEVVVQVRLRADGEVQVLQLVQGLGYGLDASAETAAREMRFQPARQNGQPVDWTGLLHIQFRLAN